jgi:hypothetical protein
MDNVPLRWMDLPAPAASMYQPNYPSEKLSEKPGQSECDARFYRHSSGYREYFCQEPYVSCNRAAFTIR